MIFIFIVVGLWFLSPIILISRAVGVLFLNLRIFISTVVCDFMFARCYLNNYLHRRCLGHGWVIDLIENFCTYKTILYQTYIKYTKLFHFKIFYFIFTTISSYLSSLSLLSLRSSLSRLIPLSLFKSLSLLFFSAHPTLSARPSLSFSFSI